MGAAPCPALPCPARRSIGRRNSDAYSAHLASRCLRQGTRALASPAPFRPCARQRVGRLSARTRPKRVGVGQRKLILAPAIASVRSQGLQGTAVTAVLHVTALLRRSAALLSTVCLGRSMATELHTMRSNNQFLREAVTGTLGAATVHSVIKVDGAL